MHLESGINMTCVREITRIIFLLAVSGSYNKYECMRVAMEVAEDSRTLLF